LEHVPNFLTCSDARDQEPLADFVLLVIIGGALRSPSAGGGEGSKK
jgi:hypothetical protein